MAKCRWYHWLYRSSCHASDMLPNGSTISDAALKFEVRKGLHYLSIVWAIALLFHAPSRIRWLIGIAAAVYVADYIFGFVKKNNLIEAAYFERYGENGVALHFKNPKSWEDKYRQHRMY